MLALNVVTVIVFVVLSVFYIPIWDGTAINMILLFTRDTYTFPSV